MEKTDGIRDEDLVRHAFELCGRGEEITITVKGATKAELEHIKAALPKKGISRLTSFTASGIPRKVSARIK